MIAVMVGLMCFSVMAQEQAERPVEPKKEWKLVGAQARELQALIAKFNEELATLLNEYKVDLLKVYPDMPEGVNFDFEKYAFVLPKPEVKEKKDVTS